MTNQRISDERLAALIRYGAPGGLAPHDLGKIVRELQERRAVDGTSGTEIAQLVMDWRKLIAHSQTLYELRDALSHAVAIIERGVDEPSPKLEYNPHCAECQRNKITVQVFGAPIHADPTGKTREPPHCPTCSCGLPLDTDSVPIAGHDPRCPAMKSSEERLCQKRGDCMLSLNHEGECEDRFHSDPTGKTREPRHCATCECWIPGPASHG